MPIAVTSDERLTGSERTQHTGRGQRSANATPRRYDPGVRRARFPLLIAASLAASAGARAEELTVATEPEPPAGAKLDVRAGIGCLQPGGRCPKSETSRKVAALFGVRGSETVVEERDPKAGLGLVSEGVAYMTDRRAGFTARSTHVALLGGGRAGLEGALGAAVGMGLWVPAGEDHGPFSRLGGRAFLLGNDSLYASLLELPELELGYQLLNDELHLELSGHVGAVLAGRYKPDDERRRLGSAFAWGGLAAARLGPVDVELDWSRIEPGDSGESPLDVLTGLVCGGAQYFGLCFDVRVFSGSAGGERKIDSVFLGLSAGALTRASRERHR